MLAPLYKQTGTVAKATKLQTLLSPSIVDQGYMCITSVCWHAFLTCAVVPCATLKCRCRKAFLKLLFFLFFFFKLVLLPYFTTQKMLYALFYELKTYSITGAINHIVWTELGNADHLWTRPWNLCQVFPIWEISFYFFVSLTCVRVNRKWKRISPNGNTGSKKKKKFY